MGNTSFTNCRHNTLRITEANERISVGHNYYASACTVCVLYGQKQNKQQQQNSDLRADGRCDSSTIYRGRGRGGGGGGSGGEAP